MANESLSAAQRTKIRRLAAPKEEAVSEGKEINVVPFLDIITNVLMFVLATVAVTFTATIDVSPAHKGIREADKKPLDLSVIVVDGGFSLKAKGGNVATGCEAAGTGLAIPKKDGAYDYKSLKDCATKLKASDPTFRDEAGVIVSANPQIPYDVVIATFDALRTSPDGDNLFPDVSFGVAR
jgi:biopolymer transport protein ExbD